MNKILETLAFLKILTYTHDSSLLTETKITMCLLLVINDYRVVSWAWNTESCAWLFKYFVNVVKSHTHQAKRLGSSIWKYYCTSFLLIPVRCGGHCLPYLGVSAEMVFTRDTWKQNQTLFKCLLWLSPTRSFNSCLLSTYTARWQEGGSTHSDTAVARMEIPFWGQ